MSSRAWAYLGLVLTGAVLLTLAIHLGSPPAEPVELWTFAILALLATVAQFLEVRYGRHSYYPHFVPFFAGVVLLSPLSFFMLIAIPHLVEWLKRRLEDNPYPWYIQPFNVASHVIAGLLAQQSYFWLTGSIDSFTLLSTGAIGVAIVVYTVVNHLLIGQILVLARQISWAESGIMELDALVTDGVMMSMGYVAALLWSLAPWMLVLILTPLALLYRALKVPQLEKEIQTDEKTGLWNARYFSETLEEQLERARHTEYPVSVIMADLDLLRNVNNSYGHQAGDMVIAGVATLIQHAVRKEDVPARFGGEEYAIVLPGLDREDARRVAERIRETVEETAFQVPNQQESIHVTMSLGVASFPLDGDNSESLIYQADIALYQAKLRGRNQVVTTQSVPHSASLVDTVQSESIPAKAAYPVAAKAAPSSYVATLPEPPSVLEENGTGPEADAERAPTIAEQATEMAMDDRTNYRLWAFLSAVILAGLSITVSGLIWNPQQDYITLALFALLALIAQWLQIEMYEKSSVSISMSIVVASALLSGVLGVAVTSTAVVVVHAVRVRPQIYKTLFNWSTHVIAGLGPVLGLQVLPRMLGVSIDPERSLWWAIPLALSLTFYYLAETGLVATAISLADGGSIMAGWREQFRWLARHYGVMGILGFFLAIAYIAMGVTGILVFSMPIVIMHLTQKEYVERTEDSVRELRRMNREMAQANFEILNAKQAMEHLNEELLVMLAKIIDARDPYVSGHATKVAEYAQSMAYEMGLSSVQQEQIYQAGLLHDIGKIGIPEKILHKPAKLTDDEYNFVKQHAALGAEFLKSCHGLRHLAPFIRHHHERWDGDGYPDRLLGDDIPVEARILALCDAVEAMASDRPYQMAKPLSSIISELEACAGSQFDPAVVKAFAAVVDKQEDMVVNSALDVLQKSQQDTNPFFNGAVVDAFAMKVDHSPVVTYQR